MEKRDILLQLIQHYTDGNKAKFARMIGITPNGLSTWISRNMFDANKIVANCEGVNPAFLLTGEPPIALTPEASGVSTPTDASLSLPDLNRRINELLSISSSLHSQYEQLGELMKAGYAAMAETQKEISESQKLLSESQRQFSRVLTIFEKHASAHMRYTMVSDDPQRDLEEFRAIDEFEKNNVLNKKES